MEDRRDRVLSDADVKAIAEAINTCPVCPVNALELQEAVKFYRNLNEFFAGSRKTLWNTFLAFSLMALLGLIGLGLWGKAT